MRMYDYTLAFIELEQLLVNGEIDGQTYRDTLKSLEGSADEKAENLCRMMDNFKAQAKLLKEEEDKLKEKRKTLENSIEWFNDSLELYLKATKAGDKQVGMYRLKYRNLPDVVNITNENLIPAAYRVPQPDKIPLTPIKQALQDSIEVPGAEMETGRTKFEVVK